MKGEFIMVDFSNKLAICNVSSDLQEIAEAFNIAISNNFMVEIRIEDLPKMDIDSILRTTITEAQIDEESNCLYIKASGLQLMFKYESYKTGTQSSCHNRFYFNSSGASLTVTVQM